MSFPKAEGEAGMLRLSLKNVTNVANQRDATLKMIRGPLGPLMTFVWVSPVLRNFGAKRANDFLQLPRSSIPLRRIA